MSAGILLLHGYSGSPENLEPLAKRLSACHGVDQVSVPCLPGHGDNMVPDFDPALFVRSIGDAAEGLRALNEKLIVLGHSTGGILALSAMHECSIIPDLLILASVPRKIDASYFARWSAYRNGRSEISFCSVTKMVSLINTAGVRSYPGTFPVLVLHGNKDELVPIKDAAGWEQGSFEGPVRIAAVPGGIHDLFRGPNGPLALDIVARAVSDAACRLSDKDQEAVSALEYAEPEAARFMDRSPLSQRHLANCASTRIASGLKPDLGVKCRPEPVFANIEITTRCNLRCTYCARSLRGSSGEDMSRETFRTVLGLLPHSYRITLVGLGETLLHPEATDFVADASRQGRRVALVTNAMLLDEKLSAKLLEAGLESIAFSIDGATQDIASKVRPGTDLDKVINNVRKFVEISRTTREISTAVFTAVSMETLASLEKLMDVVAGLGVHVIMLSDLNFRENLNRTLWKNVDKPARAIVKKSIVKAFEADLPVLSVHGLEEFGLWKRYAQFLLVPPDRLYQRSSEHTWCFSPWQTVPVNVRGDVLLCDCQPDIVAGNLLGQPFGDIWNGEVFSEHRRRMLGSSPPEACRICPRF